MREYILTSFFLFLPLVVISSNSDTLVAAKYLKEAIELQRKFKPNQAIIILKKILPVFQQAYGNESEEVSDVYYHLSSCELDLAYYDNAYKNLQKCLNLRLSLLDPECVKIGDTNILLGLYYDYQSKFYTALKYYEIALNIYKSNLMENHAKLGVVYNNMGICFYMIGDIKRAIIYFEKTYSITINKFGYKYYKAGRDLNNIGISYSKMKKYEKADECFQKAKRIAESAKTLNTVTGARSFHSIGINHYEKQEYDLAINNLDTGLLIRLKEIGQGHPEVASSYYSLGLCYLGLKEFSKAYDYFKKAFHINTSKFGDYHPEVGICLVGLGKVEMGLGNYQKALKHIENAIYAYKFDTELTVSKDSLPNKNLLEVLNTKATLHHLIYQDNAQVEQLYVANSTYLILMKLIDNFRLSYEENRSKEILADEYYKVYDGAIEVSYELFQITRDSLFLYDAFKRCEKSSSLVLLEDIRSSNAKSLVQIPTDLLEKENRIKQQITDFEKQRYEEENKPINDKDEYKITQLNSNIFDLKQEYYQFTKNLETNYPEYLSLKNNLKPVEVKEIQHILDKGQTLVEYFLGKYHVFVFIISKHHFCLEKIKKDFPLEEKVASLRANIIRYQFPFNLSDTYHNELVQTAHLLYTKLIKPVESKFSSRLIIVPGDVMAYLPFETLIKESKGKPYFYKQHQYLLNEYSIGYCYSATLLNEMLKKDGDKKIYSTLAIAPVFGKDTKPFQVRSFDFSALKYNIEEAANVSEITGGNLVSGLSATEELFNKQAPNYNILHLATHAKADQKEGEFSLLAFTELKDTLENEWLFVKDIQNLTLNCDMVTLSACETGVGEIRKGEGVISLARSFSSAGAACINTSLWKVSDRKTSDLMADFYKQIKLGKSKDKALQDAKLAFLDHYRDAEAHPFYWSPFVSIGDLGAFDPSLFPTLPDQYAFILPLIITLLLIGAGAYFLFLRWSKSPHNLVL